jgi:hypothetical protein
MYQENEASPQAIIKQKSKIPPLPRWPTSKPPPGGKRVHLRTDQVVEIGYDQEHGVPVARRTEE